jgi:hypothetical protein
MSKKLSSLILCLVLALALPLPAWAANQVHTMDIQALIYEDGSMYIVQNWEGSFDEGTECYIPMNGPDYLTISELKVSDENGAYETLSDWNINWSFEEKAGKCGINYTDSGYEICFGIGHYGHNRYAIEYKLDNVVAGYSDKDGVNFRFVNEQMNTTPSDVTVEIWLADGTPITDEIADIWGFGFEGKVGFADGGLVAYTESPLSAENHVTIMFALNKGILSPSRQEAGSFEEVQEKAFQGSDYDDVDDGEITLIGVLVTLFCFAIPIAFIIGIKKLKKKIAEKKRQRFSQRLLDNFVEIMLTQFPCCEPQYAFSNETRSFTRIWFIRRQIGNHCGRPRPPLRAYNDVSGLGRGS